MGKKVEVTQSNPCLPHEVIFFNILKRLPVETLLGFCSVSKLWYKTIHDPEFVRSILIKEKENSTSVIIGLFQAKNTEPKQKGFDYYFVHKGLEFFRIHTKKWTCSVGDCNGLYCLRSRWGFEICNPSTQEFLYQTLPPPAPPGCLKSYGFGFDPLKNAYKVVQVVHGNFARCMVYTLGVHSWEDITVKSNLSSCLNHHSFTELDGPAGMVNSDRALYLNGALYWYFRRANMVMRFDLHNETFSLIRVCFLCPWDTLHSYSCFLTEWQGCLGLAFQTPLGRSVLIYKYNLEEYDLPDFGPQHEGVRPAIEVWKKLIVELPRAPCSKVRVLGGESTTLYWFTAQGHLSFYRPKDCGFWLSESGFEREEKYPLPMGVKYPSLCEYKFSHHVENPLSLKKFVPTYRPGTKGENRIKPISSL